LSSWHSRNSRSVDHKRGSPQTYTS
jgi:hypothetical protein